MGVRLCEISLIAVSYTHLCAHAAALCDHDDACRGDKQADGRGDRGACEHGFSGKDLLPPTDGEQDACGGTAVKRIVSILSLIHIWGIYYPVEWELQLINRAKAGQQAMAETILGEIRAENERRGVSQQNMRRLVCLLYTSASTRLLPLRHRGRGRRPRPADGGA